MTTFRIELRDGWRNLLAATVGLAVGIPAYTPVSSLFLRALEQQFGWSKAEAASATIAMPITAVMLPFAGWLIDRFGVRATTAFSIVASTICYGLLSRLDGRLGPYYAGVIALNILGCATGPIGYTRLLAAQFRFGRGAALAIAQFGIALFAVVLPESVGYVMQQDGWRGGYLLLAVLSLVGGALAQILMRPVDKNAELSPQEDVGQRRIAATASFWLLGLAIMAISIATLGLVSQFQSLLIERGLGVPQATLLLSLLAVSVMVSRLVIGALLDRRNPRRVSSIVMVLAAGGSGLLLATGHGVASSVIGVALIGMSLGAELDLLAYFCALLFGTTRYARNYGALSIFFYVGIFVGGAGFGALHDRSGTYGPALVAATGLLLLAAVLLEMLPDPRRSPHAHRPTARAA